MPIDLVRNSEIETPANNPWANDLLDRKQFGENLTAVVLASKQPTTIAIDGQWGCGKTTFLQMWRQHLKNQQPAIPHVYFNAWQCDFADDPLLALAYELTEEIQSEEDPSDQTKRRFLSAATTTAYAIGGELLDRSLKAATAGLVDTALISDAADAYKQGAEDEVTDEALQLTLGIQRYQAQRQAVDGFRTTLEDYSNEIRGLAPSSGVEADTVESEQTAHDAEPPPLIVILDELDRCKPSWAVAMLERIKHLFDVPGVVFVLGVDTKQTGNAVKAIYGPAFDGDRYLSRFFDYRFGLSTSTSNMKKYIEEQAKQYELGEFAVDALIGIAVSSNLDIRTIQQALSSLRILAITMRTVSIDWLRVRRDYAHPWAATLALLKIVSPSMYQRVLAREAKTEDLIDLLFPKDLSGIDTFYWRADDTFSLSRMHKCLAALGDKDYSERYLNSVQKEMQERNIDQHSQQAKQVRDALRSASGDQIQKLRSVVEFAAGSLSST